jgi:hypothetical protein
MQGLLTEKYGTETADGWFNHAIVSDGSRNYLAPIKLDFSKRYDEGYKPLRRGESLVFVLPGSREIEIAEKNCEHPEETIYSATV